MLSGHRTSILSNLSTYPKTVISGWRPALEVVKPEMMIFCHRRGSRFEVTQSGIGCAHLADRTEDVRESQAQRSRSAAVVLCENWSSDEGPGADAGGKDLCVQLSVH